MPPDVEADYRVSDDVVASIAGMAAVRVAGVAGMGGGPGLGDVLPKRGGARGVRVEIGTREAAVDVYLHVRYGVRIPAVAQRVQEDVKRAVESMTGLRVVEVNVHVQGLEAAAVRPFAAGAPAQAGAGRSDQAFGPWERAEPPEASLLRPSPGPPPETPPVE